jgi:GTP pyrophosphokinase
VLVYGEDRPGLLADVANALSAEGSNILNAGMRAVDGDARGTFLVEVNNLNHLNRVLRAITRIKGVRAAERVQSGGE